MSILQENVRTFALNIVFAAIAAGGITWLLFNADVALRYLYLSIGVFAAIGLIFQARKRLSQHDGSIHAQIWSTVVQQEAFSSVSKVLRVVLLFAKEAALRLTYWPFEFSLMAIEDKLQGAPNVLARAAIVREFEPRIPVITAAWMLLINVVLLFLNAVLSFPRGGAFQVIVTVCMYVTIVWFVDFLFNPIEVQLRKAGTTREAILRFAVVTALSLVAVVVLIFTYRLVTNSNPSLIGVLTDVLFAGHFNADRKEIETAVSEALADGDVRTALAAAWNMELSLFVSLAVCLLFYLTILKRTIPMLLGGGSVFNRTPEESAQAGMASLLRGALDDARRYAAELPRDHPFIVQIDIREALVGGRFDEAYGMVERFVNRSRRQSKLDEPVTLDPREKWYVLSVLSTDLADGLHDLKFAMWSIDQDYLEERDLAKYIISRALRGGLPEVVALAHYLHALLEDRSERASRFQKDVVARFLIGTWQRTPQDPLRNAPFAAAFLEYLVSVFQTDKARYLLASSSLFQRASDDLDEKAFVGYLWPPRFEDWTDGALFADVQGIDRAYVADVLMTAAGLLAGSEDEAEKSVHAALVATRAMLEKHWNVDVFERLGMSTKLLQQVGSAFGVVVR